MPAVQNPHWYAPTSRKARWTGCSCSPSARPSIVTTERPFVAFHNQNTHKLAIVYRRKDGEYGIIEPDVLASELNTH
jgi:hypothetical protein